VENISLFRAEESETERELRAMLGLASPDDPEPVISTPELTSGPPGEPQNSMQAMEETPLSPLVPDSTSISNPAESIAQPSNDPLVGQSNTTSLVAPPQDQTLTEGDPPAGSTPPKTGFTEKPPPVSEPPQLPSWNPIGFVGDEEEEEEIPSINMESDSD
jgi:hypothetical protein